MRLEQIFKHIFTILDLEKLTSPTYARWLFLQSLSFYELVWGNSVALWAVFTPALVHSQRLRLSVQVSRAGSSNEMKSTDCS